MAAAAGLRVPPCSDVIQRPLDHLNGAGLLWRLSGGRIIAMYTDWAVIEINGAQRIIYRRPSPCEWRTDSSLPRLATPASHSSGTRPVCVGSIGALSTPVDVV